LPRMTLSRDEVEALAERCTRNDPKCCVLQAKDGKLVSRITTDDCSSVVVKLWARPRFRGTVRQILRTGPLDRELHILHHLRRFGVKVPEVLGSCKLSLSRVPYTNALVLEDLGRVGTAMDHLKKLLHERPGREADHFEDQVIELTERIVQASVVDADHSMINIVTTKCGRPARLDFEIARKVPSPRCAPRTWGAMMGRLVATHAFTVQPDIERIIQFATRLADRTRTPRGVLRRARILADRMMETQRREDGIDTRFELQW